jgi:hypothetical protein
MPEKKYDKYFTGEVIVEAVDKDGKGTGRFLASTRHLQDKFGGKHFSIDCTVVTKPQQMITQPHVHEFPQYLHFFSLNGDDIRNFDAVIELTVGDSEKNGKKYIITRPTAVYVPAGLYHGPMFFKVINKPILFFDIAVTAKYARVGNTSD